MPEKTESACPQSRQLQEHFVCVCSGMVNRSYLSAAVSGDSVEAMIPQALVWTGDWLLVVIFVGMDTSDGDERRKERETAENHGGSTMVIMYRLLRL